MPEQERLYLLLALFDTRDLSPWGDLVRSAREGYERAQFGEYGAWDEFDGRWSSMTMSERLALPASALEAVEGENERLREALREIAGTNSGSAAYMQDTARAALLQPNRG